MKPIKIFDILARRRMIVFGVVGVLIIGTAVGLFANFFVSSRQAKATFHFTQDKEIIGQGNFSYERDDITVPSGTTVYIDGPHSFNSLTVQDGATLTSNDFNRYGVYKTGDPSYNAKNLFRSVDESKYLFIMRGYINTGTSHNLTYSIVDGQWDRIDSPAIPHGVGVHGVASTDFFEPLASTNGNIYKESDFGESLRKATLFNSSKNTLPNIVTYTDVISSPDKPIIPFELRFYNAVGNPKFGLASCHTNWGCGSDALDYFYLKNITSISGGSGGNSLSFNLSASAPEVHTFIAWQGSGTALVDDIDSHVSTRDGFTHVVDWYRDVYSYKTECFYQANDYDFEYDDKEIIKRGDQYLTNPTYVPYSNQFEHLDGDERRYLRFYPTNDSLNSPLALRGYVDSSTISNYPILSKSLATSLSRKKITSLNITDKFNVLGNGMVNFNGKGFASGVVTNNWTEPSAGLGPGGAERKSNNTFSGADHAGLGGYSLGPGYDTSHQIDPLLPGSGGVQKDLVGNYQFCGFGGGMIVIVAKTIMLSPDSIISANGIGGNGCVGGGASGGSIILNDGDSNSDYGGKIMAIGAGIRKEDRIWPGGEEGQTKDGGGGGGYITISTSSSTSGLLSRYQSDIRKYPGNPGGRSLGHPIDWLTNNLEWSRWNFLSDTITVAGGYTECTSLGHGGIVRIVSSNAGMIGIHKTLAKISPLGGSPYNLAPNDRIQVTLHITNLIPNQTMNIRDEIFNDGAGPPKYFTLISGGSSCVISAGSATCTVGVNATASEVMWTLTPSCATSLCSLDLRYVLEVP